jgi:cell division protease FtsH
VTSGAASDIERVTRLARMMVTRWGLSTELGTVTYGDEQAEIFLGYSIVQHRCISQATVQKIDAEIQRLVECARDEAKRILTRNRTNLDVLAKGLLEYETLSGDEIERLLAGRLPIREVLSSPSAPGSSTVPSLGYIRPTYEASATAPWPQTFIDTRTKPKLGRRHASVELLS